MTTTKHKAQSAEAAERARKALEMRIAGQSMRTIAAELDVAPQTVYKYLDRALEEINEDRRDKALRILRIEDFRLDAALRAVWPKVLDGSARHVEVFIKLSERRCKLHGIDGPIKIDVSEGSIDWIQKAMDRFGPKTAEEGVDESSDV